MAGLPMFLGLELTDSSPGRLFGKMYARPELLTPFGNMHGGVLAAACDHLLGCICYPHIEAGHWAATTEFKINYLAPVSSGVIELEAELVALTKSTAVVRIEARNEGRLSCIAQGTVLIRNPRT